VTERHRGGDAGFAGEDLAAVFSVEETQVEEVDEIVVHTGYGPDEAVTRELQLDGIFATPSAPKLEHTETDFFVIGNKSYGRADSFLLEAGYWQAEQVIALLAPRTFSNAAPGGA